MSSLGGQNELIMTEAPYVGILYCRVVNLVCYIDLSHMLSFYNGFKASVMRPCCAIRTRAPAILRVEVGVGHTANAR